MGRTGVCVMHCTMHCTFDFIEMNSVKLKKEVNKLQVLTFWVCLVDATVENGCLQFVRGAHKPGT